MDDKITISTFQLFQMFPDQESARKYLESKLWPNRYVHEFSFRLNDGNCKRHTLERLTSFITATARKRLTYAALINS